MVGLQVSSEWTARTLYIARSSVPKDFPIARDRERLNAAPKLGGVGKEVGQ